LVIEKKVIVNWKDENFFIYIGFAVNSSKYIIHEYLTQNNSSPFGDWLSQINDKRARALVRTRLDRVRLGNLGDCKPVGDNIHELRIHYAQGYRIYFALDGNKIVLLLCGGSKKTQKRDILKAKEYWADYKRRLYG